MRTRIARWLHRLATRIEGRPDAVLTAAQTQRIVQALTKADALGQLDQLKRSFRR